MDNPHTRGNKMTKIKQQHKTTKNETTDGFDNSNSDKKEV